VNGQAVVDIQSTDTSFTSQGCGTWTSYVAPAQVVTQFGEGQWVVGAVGTGQIAPGTYHTSGGAKCSWATLKGFTGQPTDIIQQGDAASPGNVTIPATAAGFTSTSCGTWSKAA
jgi:hypothetical protein